MCIRDRYYVSGGYSIPITWNKSGKNDKTIYKIKSSGCLLYTSRCV